MEIRSFLQSKRLQINFLVAGSVSGLFYWKFLGDGSNLINSVWYWSVLVGAALGYILGDVIDESRRKQQEKKGRMK